MKTLASAALAALLASGPALADAPAPAPAAGAQAAPTAKPREGLRPAGKKGAAAKDAKDAPRPAHEPKEAPCEPVKPCPIE
ncbi:MAG TPA: hypothetical protein VLT47_02705 [Anaeromyxobacteraceae bacterium]|nr:hypothetical protein [Anaeromyxobacteraceae bacterium]